MEGKIDVWGGMVCYITLEQWGRSDQDERGK